MFNTKKRKLRVQEWRDELARYVYSTTFPIEGWKLGRTDDPAVKGKRFDDSRWPVAPKGKPLGRNDEFLWLRAQVTVPKEMAGQDVALRIEMTQTGLVYVTGADGATRAFGLDYHHGQYPLVNHAKGGERFTVAVEVYTGAQEVILLHGFGDPERGPVTATLGAADLAVVNADAYKLYHDLAAVVDLLSTFAEGSREEAEIAAVASAAIDAVNLQAPAAARDASFKAASRIFAGRLFSGRKGDASGAVKLIGQSHIDLAWLWPRAETVRKFPSTLSNALLLQERYPWYRFSQSQAEGFQWMKDFYPEVYERVKAAVKAGRVEVTGGMWAEADLNCAGGEALARQFLYGQQFFRREFGVTCRVGWLIDTFGYNWSMPQILAQSGIEYFTSTKPNWNDTNKFPFTFFQWEGPDGTRILTHVPPLSYGGGATARAVSEALKRQNEPWLQLAPAILYGKSDGGGGPRVEDMERIPRLAATPYAPKVEVAKVADFFDALPKDAPYPVYCDEMYVELHRGTYTSQARTKRNNRKAECALSAAETAASIASILGAAYPKEELDAAWKLALFNQFHDILPGSSINCVYKDSARDYEKVFAATREINSAALSYIARNADTRGDGAALLVFNPSLWDRADIIEIDAPAKSRILDSSGKALPCQNVSGARGRKAVLVTVPSCGWTVIRVVGSAEAPDQPAPAPGPAPVSKVKGRQFDTPHYTLKLNAAGQISRLYDRDAEREVIAAGQAANRLELMEDIPVEYEAWDIDEWARDKAREVKDLAAFEVVENGPVRTVVNLAWNTGRSTITQRMTLYAHTRRIDFATEVDWHERKRLLKAAFPVAVRARRATYEIAFGAIDRSTKESNPWDWARFEVPAHKWADLSQADYGVSILNDSKYGYGILDNVMRISLLRSPEAPDPEADQGRHEFTYSLYPHAGVWSEGGTVKEASDLNTALSVIAAESSPGGLPPEGWIFKPVAEDGAFAVLSALKMAEDGSGFVLRVYEPHGRDAAVTILTPVEVRSAGLVNLIEDSQGDLRHGENSFPLTLSPWSIKSALLRI